MDAYQQAVEFLTENPKNILGAWSKPDERPGGCLFRIAADSDHDWMDCYGCLTGIRNIGNKAQTAELTQAIRNDSRIPGFADLAPEHLPVCAGWQRRIDHLLGRKPPEMDPRIPLPKKEIEFVELPELVSA
jgi:hypothetical protein